MKTRNECAPFSNEKLHLDEMLIAITKYSHSTCSRFLRSMREKNIETLECRQRERHDQQKLSTRKNIARNGNLC